MNGDSSEVTEIKETTNKKSNKFLTFEFIQTMGLGQLVISLLIVIIGVSRTTWAYSSTTKGYEITSGNQVWITFALCLVFVISFSLTTLFIRINREDKFIQSLSLKFVKKLRPTIFVILIAFYITFFDVGLTLSNPLPIKYAYSLLSLSTFLVYSFAALILYLFLIIFIYYGTPKIDGVDKSIFRRSIYGVGGIEIVSIMRHFEEYPGLTTVYSKFLFNSLHSILHNVLQFGYPRFRIESLEETITNLYITVKQGTKNEKAAVKQFLNNLIELEKTPASQLTIKSSKFLDEISNLNSQLKSASDLRVGNKMKGIWNLSIIYFLEQNSTALVVIFTIVGVFLVGITLLLSAHLL